jgi:hypothetical protein
MGNTSLGHVTPSLNQGKVSKLNDLGLAFSIELLSSRSESSSSSRIEGEFALRNEY